MAQATSPSSTELTQAQFRKTLTRLDGLFQTVGKSLKEIASILAECSRPQLLEVKRRFRNSISSDQIERLALFGQGKVSWHLAEAQRGITASVLRRLPAPTMKVVNSPNNVIEVLTDRGVRRKMVTEVNAYEWQRVIDDEGSICTPEQQSARLLKPAAAAPTPSVQLDVEEFESVGKSVHPNCVLIVGRRGSKIEIPLATLKKWL
jgi:hypothetical protein